MKVEINKAEVGGAASAVAAQEQFDVTDAKGRVLTLKRPGVLAQFRLVEALGDAANNQVYFGMVAPILFVVAIDGSAAPSPRTKAEVEALIQRLDEHGLACLHAEIPARFGGAAQEDALKKSAE